MPLYEYLCESCGRKTEVIQLFSDSPLTTCDRCGGSLRKLLSSSAVRFKGSGWYVSDYGRPGGKEKGKEGESAKPAESGDKAAGAEAKPGAAQTPAEKGTDSGASGAGAGAGEKPSSNLKKKKSGPSN